MLTMSVGNAWPFGCRGGGKAVALKTESAGHESSRRASAAVPNSQLSRKGLLFVRKHYTIFGTLSDFAVCGLRKFRLLLLPLIFTFLSHFHLFILLSIHLPSMGRHPCPATSPEFIEDDTDDNDTSDIYIKDSGITPTTQYDENNPSTSGNSSPSSSLSSSPILASGPLPTSTSDAPSTSFESTIDKLLVGGVGSSKSGKAKGSKRTKGKKDKGAHFLPSYVIYMLTDRN